MKLINTKLMGSEMMELFLFYFGMLAIYLIYILVFLNFIKQNVSRRSAWLVIKFLTLVTS